MMLKDEIKVIFVLLLTLLTSNKSLSSNFELLPKNILPHIYKDLSLSKLVELRSVQKSFKINIDKYLNNPYDTAPYIIAEAFMSRIPEFCGNDINGKSGYFKWFSEKVSEGDSTVQKTWLSNEVKNATKLMVTFDEIYSIITASSYELDEMADAHIASTIDCPNLPKYKFMIDSEKEERSKIHHFYRWVRSRFSLKSFPCLSFDRKLMECEDLWLTDEDLSFLSPSISRLQKLRGLWLWAKDLAYFPTCLLQLKNLETLSIKGCKSKTLPNRSGNLTNIERIILSDGENGSRKYYNLFEALPAGFICNMKKLSYINLRGSFFKSLPECLQSLPDIRNLWVSGNPLDMESINMLVRLHNKRKEEGKSIFYLNDIDIDYDYEKKTTIRKSSLPNLPGDIWQYYPQ